MSQEWRRSFACKLFSFRVLFDGTGKLLPSSPQNVILDLVHMADRTESRASGRAGFSEFIKWDQVY